MIVVMAMIIMILIVMMIMRMLMAMIVMIVVVMTITRMIDMVMVTMLSGRHLTQIFLGLSAACTLPHLKYQIQQNIVSPFSIPHHHHHHHFSLNYLMWPTIVYSYFNFDAL